MVKFVGDTVLFFGRYREVTELVETRARLSRIVLDSLVGEYVVMRHGDYCQVAGLLSKMISPEGIVLYGIVMYGSAGIVNCCTMPGACHFDDTRSEGGNIIIHCRVL